ncbi:MAG TPA: DUF4038 domain-containing protein, partial [Chthoniobacteraceae bacterium]|nr:DUF4038 domain-containing protein [Chthoniobacteraceae bacterium]
MKTLPLLMTVALLPVAAVAAESLRTETNVPVEIAFTAKRAHADPFNDVTLDVTFTDPAGTARKVPAFWAGGVSWKVRYASPLVGTHRWRSECSDATDAGLHGVESAVEVTAYAGENPLLRHGPVRVAADARHFEHADGTPFFWLGDTWWMGLCHRLHWPEEFQRLAADRKAKGFNVVQIVAGLYPDMHPFDARGANETGFPWEKDYARIRPEYFDAADARLRHLVEQGITPCIVGAWGYYMPWMGAEKMKAHWRYLIARYGAMPVIWCAAGEANLPWYLAQGFPYDDREQVHGWTEVLRFIRATDLFRRPLTIHPTAIKFYTARHATDDATLLDFDMLQTPHGQREAAHVAVQAVRDSMAAMPAMPVINGEAAYEMLSDSLPTEWTRAIFWLCMMNGAKGHTYGANGIWQCNRRGQPHGSSPTTGSPPTGYGVISWDEAMALPGSTQLGLGKRFFESLPWTQLAPMPESVAWAEPAASDALGDWIWFPEGDPKRDAPVATRYFRRTFEVSDTAAIRRATLRMSADDKFTVLLNGKELGFSANWQAPMQFDVAPALHAGLNVLAVRAENLPAPVPQNPAGLTAALTLVRSDDTRITIRTDATWRTATTEHDGWLGENFMDSTWSPALVTA